jgi:hypothetical protein
MTLGPPNRAPIFDLDKARLMRTGGALLRYEGEVFDRPGQPQIAYSSRLLLVMDGL